MIVYLWLPVLVFFHRSPVIDSASRHGSNPLLRMRRMVPEYNIDVLAIVDWKMYEHWLDLYQQEENEAETAIKKYVALVFKGVNHRYSQFDDFKLSVNLAEIKIFKDKSAAQVTPTDTVINIVSANTTLHNLTSYVKRNGLSNYDHVMLFTGHDIYSADNGAMFRYTTGQAFVGTMCKGQEGDSVSVIEDRGAFQSVHTASHELAHSLNASHDGSQNSCRLGDRYIMAGGSSNVTAANVFNPWFFSTCSKQEMSSFLTKAAQTYGTCLRNAIQKHASVPDVLYKDTGQLYSPDALCQHIYGRNSYYCRSLGNVSAICYSMYCRDNSLLNKCNEHHAADFTSCGDKEWCVDGQCTFSDSAPSKDASCVHGDEPSARINGKTCTELISESVAYCYNATTRVQCCQTCKNAATGVQGCEYGDKVKGCNPNYCKTIEPNGDVFDDACCGTCNFSPKEWKCLDSSTPGLDCARVESYDCYKFTVAFNCCARCANVREKENKGCEYGDKTGNCDVLTSRGRLCEDDVKPFCCKTCAPQDVNSQHIMTSSELVLLVTVVTSIVLLR